MFFSGGGADTSVTRGLVARVHASAARLAEAAERQRKATEELEAEAAVADAEAADEEGGMGSIVEQAIELAVAGVRKRESEGGGGGGGGGWWRRRNRCSLVPTTTPHVAVSAC